MQMNESAENYLETILILSKRLPVVRSVDIAAEMNFKKSSISVAMKHLRENGYISMASDGFITLNDSGLEIASRVYHRHRTLTELFTLLGVSPENAAADACKVEHDLSEETFARIHDFVKSRKA